MFFASLITPTVAAACSQEYFGGGLPELRAAAADEFWRAKEIAWAAGALTRSDTQSVQIASEPSNTTNMWINDRTVFLTDYFLRASIHLAVRQTFAQIDATRFMKPADVIAFDTAVFQNAALGRSTDYYPYFLGLSEEECWEAIRNSNYDVGLTLRLQIQTLWHFWFLHELAHYKLGHSPSTNSGLSWQQEYAADRWAITTMNDFFRGPETVVFYSSVIARSLSVFNGSQPHLEFFPTTSHPAPSCRKLRIYEFARDLFESSASVQQMDAPVGAMQMNAISENYLREGNLRSGVGC